MKSLKLLCLEGTLYVIIASGAPWTEFLYSDKELSTRSLCAVGVVSLIAGATALKAFLSQFTTSAPPPMSTTAVVPPPLPVVEQH